MPAMFTFAVIIAVLFILLLVKTYFVSCCSHNHKFVKKIEINNFILLKVECCFDPDPFFVSLTTTFN